MDKEMIEVARNNGFGVKEVKPLALKRGSDVQQHRREKLREQCYESQQLDYLIKELGQLTDLRKEISLRKPSAFDRQVVNKYNLSINALKVSMDKRLAILAKVLPDEKHAIIDDKEAQAPQLKLTIVPDKG